MNRRTGPVMVPLLLLAIACQPSTPPQGSTGGGTTPNQPAVEQKAVLGVSNLVNTLDQHVNVGLDGRRYDIFDPLVVPDDKGDPSASIASSWRTIDPKTWEFKLRSDMKWHDGTALTADDVKFTFDRIMDPANKLAAASRLPTLDNTKVIDKTTIQMTTKDPDPILLRRLMTLSVIPKAYFEKVGAEQFGVKPIGTGPFKVKEWKPGDSLTLIANDEHPFRKPILRELVIKSVPEGSARVAGLKTGDIDFANLIPLDQVAGTKSAGIEIINTNGGASYGFTIDPILNDKPIDGPTSILKVRQAINYAVDKESIAKNVFLGQTGPEAQLAQPETFGYNPNVKPYAYDPAKAKQLLAEAGYANGFSTKMEIPTIVPEAQAMALIIQQNLKDVGINAELSVLADVAVWREGFYNTKPRAPLFFVPLNNSPAYDADFSLQWFWSKNSAKHYNNPAFDTAYEASKTELDVNKRKALLQQAIQVMYDDAPFLWLVPAASNIAYNPKKITGVKRYVDDIHYEQLKKVG